MVILLAIALIFLRQNYGLPSSDRVPIRPVIVTNSGAQDKILTPGDIGLLERYDFDEHELKGGKRTGQIDLYK